MATATRATLRMSTVDSLTQGKATKTLGATKIIDGDMTAEQAQQVDQGIRGIVGLLNDIYDDSIYVKEYSVTEILENE